jgi:hypothetical protein
VETLADKARRTNWFSKGLITTDAIHACIVWLIANSYFGLNIANGHIVLNIARVGSGRG